MVGIPRAIPKPTMRHTQPRMYTVIQMLYFHRLSVIFFGVIEFQTLFEKFSYCLKSPRIVLFVLNVSRRKAANKTNVDEFTWSGYNYRPNVAESLDHIARQQTTHHDPHPDTAFNGSYGKGPRPVVFCDILNIRHHKLHQWKRISD